MIIDAHCHAFLPEDIEGLVQRLAYLDESMPDENPHKWRLDMGGTLEDVLDAQSNCSIDRFVLLPVTSRTERVSTMNHWAVEQAGKYEQIIPFGSLLPGCDLQAELQTMKDLGIKGIKLHPFIQRFRLESPETVKMFDAIEQSGLPVLIDTLQDEGLVAAKPHMGPILKDFGLHGCEAEELAFLAKAHPGTKFIAAHGGSCYGWDQIQQLNELDNIYYDLSWIGYLIPADQILKIIRGKGADRIVYGSDAPFREPCSYLDWFGTLKLSNQEREMILGGTMESLL